MPNNATVFEDINANDKRNANQTLEVTKRDARQKLVDIKKQQKSMKKWKRKAKATSTVK